MWKQHPEPGDDMLLSLSKHLVELEKTKLVRFPFFLGNQILIASDYSKGASGTDFFVATFLMVDWSQTNKWDTLRLNIRNEFLTDGRRMSYKKLGDAKRSNALNDFLLAADEHTGILIRAGFKNVE
jgi:hypothetical protein